MTDTATSDFAVSAAGRGVLMDSLRALGVDGPEALTRDLGNEAIEGVVRWGKDQNRKGRSASSGLLANKLRAGGLEGYGVSATPSGEWYRTYQGRTRWLETNLPHLDPVFAEAAIVSLVREKRDPSPELVRKYTELGERQQAEHDQLCEKKVAA